MPNRVIPEIPQDNLAEIARQLSNIPQPRMAMPHWVYPVATNSISTQDQGMHFDFAELLGLDPRDTVQEEPNEEEPVSVPVPIACQICASRFPDSENGVMHNGRFICNDCAEDGCCFCDACERALHTDNVYYGDSDSHYCCDCFYENYFVCSSCDVTFSREGEYYEMYSSGNYLCHHCYEQAEGFECDACGNYFYSEEMAYRSPNMCQNCCDMNGRMYSSDFARRLRERNALIPPPQPRRRLQHELEPIVIPREEQERFTGVNSYGFKPLGYAQITDGEKVPFYIGWELETECEGNKVLDVPIKLCNKSKLPFYLKGDSSIHYGFEIVTHPYSLGGIRRDQKDWIELLTELRKLGCRSHNTLTCGLHFHVSRKAFTSVSEVKLGMFFYGNSDAFERLGRRDCGGYCQKKDPKQKGFSRNVRFLAPNNPQRENWYMNRHDAINYNNIHTIEIRSPRGTLNGETLLATWELIHSLASFVTSKDKNGIYFTKPEAWADFVLFCCKGNYEFLPNYLKAKGFLGEKEAVKCA